jgi:hypothetical protein
MDSTHSSQKSSGQQSRLSRTASLARFLHLSTQLATAWLLLAALFLALLLLLA